MVQCICYGRTRTFPTREEAIKFYLKGIAECDGSEKDRYIEIYLDLISGYNVCTDERKTL